MRDGKDGNRRGSPGQWHTKAMNRQYISERHLVERYLADQLDDAEREAFEAYWREHPEIVAEMEAVARLKVGLAALRESNQLTTLPSAGRAVPRLFALAAAVAIVAVGAVVWVATRAPSEPVLVAAVSSLRDRSGRALSIASTHTILRMRGAASDARIELPPSSQAIELRILPEVDNPAPASYRLQLLREQAGRLDTLGSIESLSPAADGFVTAYLSSSQLLPGQYRLRLQLEQPSPSEPATSEFSLMVVPADAARR
jgi:hypothetical protein